MAESIRADDPSASPPRRERDPWRRFALIFAALAVASELVYYGVALESALFQSYLAALAKISGFILGFFTERVSVRGTYISSALFSVEIARGCDAYRICSLLSAAILAFPARLRTKLWGLALGLLWLNFLNFVRIIGLFFIGGYAVEHFQASHEIYFPIFLICMTMAAWIVWVRQATRDAIHREPTSA
ncbi:MAG: exosortase H [Myxococcales bacterium]|nr:exosortase H [Myxococcales bacterium]MDH5567137.1 exosortase H [Myxococcales bacterium]